MQMIPYYLHLCTLYQLHNLLQPTSKRYNQTTSSRFKSSQQKELFLPGFRRGRGKSSLPFPSYHELPEKAHAGEEALRPPSESWGRDIKKGPAAPLLQDPKDGDYLLSHLRSTIGVTKLNFSVRNGKRWNLRAIVT